MHSYVFKVLLIECKKMVESVSFCHKNLFIKRQSSQERQIRSKAFQFSSWRMSERRKCKTAAIFLTCSTINRLYTKK